MRTIPLGISPSFRAAARALIATLAALFVTSIALSSRADPKREPQDYGGAPRETTAEDALSWVPRVALFPLWLTSEYVVRRPIGALVKVAEREQWPEEIIGFFTFGSRHQITVYPSALFDFGLLPSVGINAEWKYFVTDPNTLRIHAATWGPDWIAARAVDRYDFNASESASFDTSVERRQDHPFFGMGPRSGATGRLRYQATALDASIHYKDRFWRSSTFTVAGGMRALTFGSGTCCGEPALEDAVARGTTPAPPGFGRGYTAAYERIAIAVDSRKPRPEEGSGFRAEVHGEGVFAPDSSDPNGRRAWVNYGGSLGAALDLTKTQRVVSLTLSAALVDPLQGVVPFTDQITLGGDRGMPGYLAGRLVDRSALVATLKYAWPIWVFLDGVIEADVGNVFGAHFEGFDPGLLRLTSGIGIRSSGARDSGFELLVAGGTDPFDSGFHVTSFRFVIGSHHGF